MLRSNALVAFPLVLGLAGSVVAHDVTTRESVDSSGVAGNHGSRAPSLSADGRFVAFDSDASNLVAGDTNGWSDVFVHDRLTGETTRVSVNSDGYQVYGRNSNPSISADGRFVAFESDGYYVWPPPVTTNIYVHDRQTGVTEIVSVDDTGYMAMSACSHASISADGRYVAFDSWAPNLVTGDTNKWQDVFVHDRLNATTMRVSVHTNGTEGNERSRSPSISADGQRVAFESYASNLVSGDSGTFFDIFVHDFQTGKTTRESVDPNGAEAYGDSHDAALSPDGRYVAFDSLADNLVSGDTAWVNDIFVHDCTTQQNTRVSVGMNGEEANSFSHSPVISRDGRRVAFLSMAWNLVPGDVLGGVQDVFTYDLVTQTTERASPNYKDGGEGNDHSFLAAITDDGRFVAFGSIASDLIKGDKYNGETDVFMRGPFLTLAADPPLAPAGATLTLSTWTGDPSGASLLAATAINGAPAFIPVVFGNFDAAGVWTLSATVPSGLSGIDVAFATFGIVSTGKVDVSNAATVSFQ